MCDLRYPVGMATFSELIEEGYAYVDKTQFIQPLLRHGKFIFLSRPRRFGKSLLLSTLQAYFEGRRELFRGLAAYRMNLDWTPSPVLRFDFNSEEFDREDGLDILIGGFLKKYEKIYGCAEQSLSISQQYNKSVKEALDQIRDRDYAGRFAMDSRKIYLIGANFEVKKDKRGLEYEIKEI